MLILTPFPKALIKGITLSRPIHWMILGAAYCAPRQDERDDMYRPNKNNTPTKAT